MKRKYINPTTEIIKCEMESHLMEPSKWTVGDGPVQGIGNWDGKTDPSKLDDEPTGAKEGFLDEDFD